ncbi:MAG: hypothetical protein ACE5GO_07580 [Anaerolineales bacterium]
MTVIASFEQTRRQSSTIVILVTAVALLLGWVVKSSTQNRSRDFSHQGVSAKVPAGWLVQKGDDQQEATGPNQITRSISGDDPNLVFMTWDSLHPERRFGVSLYPSSADTTLASTASVRNLQRGQSLSTYRVIEETAVTVKGRDGYKVTFAYVDPGNMGDVPTVVQGADYYFDGDQTLVITLEVDDAGISDAMSRFLKFLQSVQEGKP